MLRVRELDWRARIGDSSSAGKPSAWGNLNQEIPQVADDSSYETVVGSAPKTASRRDLLAHCARSAEAHRPASDLPVHHTCIIPCYHMGAARGRPSTALHSTLASHAWRSAASSSRGRRRRRRRSRAPSSPRPATWTRAGSQRLRSRGTGCDLRARVNRCACIRHLRAACLQLLELPELVLEHEVLLTTESLALLV